MGRMAALLAVARATNRAVASRGLTVVSLLVFSLAIILSQYLVLFEFYREANAIREMAGATITLWGLLIVIVMSGALVTHELEDRTAVLLLSKPLPRGRFLVAKFLGVMAAVSRGVALLTLVFLFTLWVHSGSREVALYDTFETPAGPWEHLLAEVLLPKLAFAIQGALLSLLQVAILAAMSVSFAAFLPLIASVSATSLFYVLGHIARYFVATVGGPAAVLAWLIPNFGYLNPTVQLSEGRILSAGYLLWVTLYSTMYVALVLRIATLLFERRDIR
jgi:Cu-processing system permease protein